MKYFTQFYKQYSSSDSFRRLVGDMILDAHLASAYAKPKGRPRVDTSITEVSQDN